MPTPSELLENDITDHREVYHLFQHRESSGEPADDWVLMKHNAERATARGEKAQVYERANELLEDPGLSSTGALIVIRWELSKVQGHWGHRIRKIMVGSRMGAGRVGANESKFSTFGL